MIQGELREHLASTGKKAVLAGTVVHTSSGSLPFGHSIHAVAIDPFYDSSVELVRDALLASCSQPPGLVFVATDG